MKTTHTPGPWAQKWNARVSPERCSIIDNSGKTICTINPREEDQDNANLIAAAPELLEIASDIFDKINSKQIDANNGIVIDSYTWHKLNSAIQKATQP